MRPINDIWICLNLGDFRPAVFTIVVCGFPPGHPAVNAVGINSQILQIFDVEIDIALDCTDVASADTCSIFGKFNCFDVLSKSCRSDEQL